MATRKPTGGIRYIQPDWLGGITNTFTYKGIQLSILIDGRQGGQVYSMSKYNQMAGGTGKFTENRTNLNCRTA